MNGLRPIAEGKRVGPRGKRVQRGAYQGDYKGGKGGGLRLLLHGEASPEVKKGASASSWQGCRERVSP